MLICLSIIVTGTTELETISFFKDVGFKSDLKNTDGVSLPHLDWELVNIV